MILLAWQVGAEIVEAACVIEMPDLKGKEKLGDTLLYAQVEKAGQWPRSKRLMLPLSLCDASLISKWQQRLWLHLEFRTVLSLWGEHYRACLGLIVTCSIFKWQKETQSPQADMSDCFECKYELPRSGIKDSQYPRSTFLSTIEHHIFDSPSYNSLQACDANQDWYKVYQYSKTTATQC